MRKTLLGTALCAAAVIATAGLSSPAAAAGATDEGSQAAAARWWKHHMQTDDGRPGGGVWFQPDGDRVYFCDNEEDGWAVQLDVYDVTRGAKQYSEQVGGYGNCLDFRARHGGKYDLREGNLYRFTICLDKAGTSPQYCDSANWRNDND